MWFVLEGRKLKKIRRLNGVTTGVCRRSEDEVKLDNEGRWK